MNVPEAVKDDAHGVKAGMRAAEEDDRRASVAERIKKEGAARTFEPLPGVNQDAPFLDEGTKYVVFSLAHKRVPPIATGPRFRINGAFATIEAARQRALAVHDADSGTVTIGEMQGWQVCARDMRLLQDARAGLGHASALLAAHERLVGEAEDRAAVQKHVQMNEHVSIADILPSLSKAQTETVEDWLQRSKYTVSRLGALTDEEGRELGVSAEDARARFALWAQGAYGRSQCAVLGKDTELPEQNALGAAAADISTAGEPEPETDQSGDPAPKNTRPMPLYDPRLQHRLQNWAVVAMLTDSSVVYEDSQPCFAVYGVFDTEENAEGYVRNVASSRVHDHNLHIVSMYEWLDPNDAGCNKVVYRDNEMQRIVDAQSTQANRIQAMENDVPRDKQAGGGMPLVRTSSARPE